MHILIALLIVAVVLALAVPQTKFMGLTTAQKNNFYGGFAVLAILTGMLVAFIVWS